MKPVLKLLFSLIISTPAFSALETLQEIRPKLVYPDYTDEEKQLVADQAYILADQLYVHRALKIQAFGPGVDPVARLLNIKKIAKTLTPEQLNDAIGEVFQDQRDLHFQFIRPAPISNWSAWLPTSFAFVKVGDSSQTIVATVSKAAKARFPEISQIHMGDRVLTYDGMNMEDALKMAGALGSGANDDAWRSRAIEILSFRNFSDQKIPEKNSVTLLLERHNGEQYTIELPWLAYEEIKVEDISGSATEHKNRKAVISWTDALNDYQVKYNKLFRRYSTEHNSSPSMLGLSGLGATDDKTIFKGIVTTSSGRFGFLRFDSFMPTLPVLSAIAMIRTILIKDFADTDGLIIDIRDNGGGNITYADMLVQLFSSENIQPTRMTILATPLNQELFDVGNLGTTTEWSQAIANARQKNETLSKPIDITSVGLANNIGQYWFKPVALLTNANCYSACDLFAASMQDHNSATIIGEDHTTGAGGANVMEHKNFISAMEDKNETTLLESLPFQQNMRVSWRQAIRAGKHEGELIENIGVISDYILPRTEEDLYHNDAFLLEKIAAILDLKRPNRKASIAAKESELLFENGRDAAWREYIKNTDTVEVFSNQKSIAKIGLDSEKIYADISVPGSSTAWRHARYEIIGYNEGRRAWRVWRNVRWVGAYENLKPGKPLRTDFAQQPKFLHVENPYSSEDSGWQIRDGVLAVGLGPNYANDLLTTAFVPINSTGLNQITISFDLKLQSEKGLDQFRVYARDAKTYEREDLLSLSGDKEGKQILGLKKLIGREKLELVFEFQSDGNVVGAGPSIDNLEIKGGTVSILNSLTDLFKVLPPSGS